MTSPKKRAANIRLAAFDIDGVLTDGTLTYDDRGREYKTFHAHDGLGLKLLQQAGIAVAVISARQSTVVEIRMRELGIELVYQGQQDKLKALHQLLQRLSLEPSQVAYTGDDLQDLPVMRAVGFAVAVANAVTTVKQAAHWVTERSGGRGAVREICEYILSAQDKSVAALPAGATQ
jgi:3-deoxy-D-manno-octulosonate 8-phosphate phosphatase (KDO 8-P phosphatase)